jgi:DNA-binding NarL/FixJ family response regulator
LADALPGVTVSEASTLYEALGQLNTCTNVSLASFDLTMPGMRDGEALREIRHLYPRLPIAVLSGHESRQLILESLAAGASGFIPKSLSAGEIVAAIMEVMTGRIFGPPRSTAIEPDSVAPPPPVLPAPMGPRGFDPTALTPRQRDVFALMMNGRSTKEIARSLAIAEGTVKIYLAAIFRQLDARNRVEAVTKALGMGVEPMPRDQR